MLRAVGIEPKPGGGIDPKAKMRTGALKLLRHVYLLNQNGNRKVWIVSLPNAFKAWPSDQMNTTADNQLAVKALLDAGEERFSEEQKRHLAMATIEALAWCQRAGMVLATAASEPAGPTMELVKRWFADPATSDADLKSFIGRLAEGIKRMISLLGQGKFILTDWVPLRGATSAQELGFLNSEAFTFPLRTEGLDVVYIEQSFFVDHPGNVLKGPKNWTRIVVHELSHLAAGTEDVVQGKSRYAWYGIGPHAGFPGSLAIRNADSWAFFCADCAGALTANERGVALKIV